MSSVAIVTDSTADLPEELYEKYNITVVPLSVIFNDRAYIDNGKELTKKEFYQKLKTSKKLPTTAQPSPADFKKIYENLLKKHENIISIHISKKMSGTSDSAEIARKELINSMQGMIKDSSKLIVTVADADLKEDGDELLNTVKEVFNPKLIMRSEVGCIVGTHLGPAIAISFYE